MYCIDYILKVIDYKNNTDKSNRWIAYKLKISRMTVKRWYDKYTTTLINLKERIYNNKVYEEIKKNKQKLLENEKFNLKIIHYFTEILNKNPFLTNKFNIKFNINKINLLITRLHYTYKKPRQYIIKNNLFHLKKKQSFFLQIQHQNKNQRFLF